MSLSLYEPIGDGTSSGDYRYVALGASFGQFSVTLGTHFDNTACPSDDDDGVCDSTHLNLDYAYNDNLTFTFSQFIADEPQGDDLKVVVSYSLPIESIIGPLVRCSRPF